MKYLTRAKKEKPDLPDVFSASEAPIPPVRKDVETMDAINAFIRRERQQKAGGGMLVQPNADGSRPGYRGDKVQTAKEIESIKLKTEPLNKGEKLKLYRSYDDLFKQEYKRLVSLGDPFSKIDLNRAVINRIAKENPTINLQEGIGLDKIPGGGNEESKTLFERYDKTSARGPLFTKKELKNFTQGNQVFARANTKTQEILFKTILKGNTDKTQLAKTLGISEGRLSYNLEKLMRNLVKGSGDQYTFLKDFKEKDLEKVRNNIYESPTLENSYQRTILQSVYASTKLGSEDRKKALNKLKEFNKFKKVMVDNGLNPKILALDHAASYRALKNGNLKTFLSVTPVITDINQLKSTFDKRSQLNLRRMKDYLLAGDNKNYKYFLKNQTELENLWKTMTGGQSSLGKIRVTATGPRKGELKIFNYGATSLLDKNKNLIDELANNLDIRKNIVNASSVENLNEARRIMLEGSELTEKKMLGTFSSTDRAARTQIDKSFKNLNKKEMFKQEQKIANLISSYSKLSECKINKAEGGRIGFANSITCIQDGLKEQKIAAQNGNKKAAQELVQVGKVATRAGLLKNILGPGALLGEAMIEGAIIGNKVLGGKPADIAYAESYISFLDPRKYRGELDPLKMAREDMLTREVEDAEGNIKTINAPGFSALKSGFEAQDQISAFNKAIEERDLAARAGENIKYAPAAADAREQGARVDQSANIISSDSFKDASRVAQEYLQGQTGANIAKYRTDDFGRFESGRDKDLRRRRMQEMSNIMPRDFLTEKTSDLLNRTQALRELGYDVSTRDLMAQQDAIKAMPLSVAARMYSPEQVYGTQGEFAGGGIAKLAGDSSGRPPVRGPNPQGLLSLKNRVRNY
jgi:hypothetical protein